MGVIRCSMGHYYDDAKFSYCPHCGVSIDIGPAGAAESSASGAQAGQGTAPKKKGLFFWKNQAPAEDKTVAFSSTEEAAKGLGGAVIDEGKTVAMKSVAETAADDDQKTVGIYSGAMGNDMVMGWLVCTKGPERGRDYRIKNGFNYIGRAVSSEIVIMEDVAISKDKHCAIVYDNKNIAFMAVPGNGTLTYLKGELLGKPEKLTSGDEITLGESTFVFIPFCVEGRVWED